ncbi:MAG: hypothetical protein ACJ74T_10985 [Pyrinomonadaceae bacterium]
MKKPRRTELRLLLLLLALLTACVPHAHGAQERATRTPQTKAKQTAKPARDPKERERRERQQAAAAVNEAVASSSEFKDSYKRTLLLALAADALWTFDEPAARSLFARAWESAVASDEEANSTGKGFRDESSAQSRPDSSDDTTEFFSNTLFTRVTRARYEVLSAASRHDARLTERYLAEFREAVERRTGKGDPRAGDDRGRSDYIGGFSLGVLENEEIGAGERMRLDLSQTLVEEGNYSQAAEVAAHGLTGGVSAALIQFLLQFRRDAPAEADALYVRLLARTAADPRADPNDVLLLSTYALMPELLVSVTAQGGVRLSPLNLEGAAVSNDNATTPVARAVRQEFFNTAATVLLRASTQRPAGTPEARQRAAALFFTLARLLPFFEREAPQLAPQLEALRQSAAAEMSEMSRDMLSRSAATQTLDRQNPTDPLQADLDYAKRGPLATARDAARQSALRQAVKLKLWDRAREAIAGMEDADLRADSLNVLAVCQVAAVGEAFDDDEEGDEHAAQFVENAQVPPLTRALGYTRAALLASKLKRPPRAAALLERARDYAEQTDAGREARFVALLFVATAAEQADPARVWSLLPALVRATNEVGDAPADELSGGFRVPHLEGAENVGVAPQLTEFRLDDLFAALGRRDFARALREARGLKDATTRSLVIVSAARARLAAGKAGAR